MLLGAAGCPVFAPRRAEVRRQQEPKNRYGKATDGHPVKRAFALVCLLVATGLAGCTSPEEAHVSIHMIAKPAAGWREAHVVLAGVGFLKTGANGTVGYGGDAAWVRLPLAELDVDTAATRRSDILLGQLKVPPGDYSAFNLEVGSAYGVDMEGVRHNATVVGPPLETPLALSVVSGQAIRLDVRLDASHWEQRGERGWLVRPAITQAMQAPETGSGSSGPAPR